MDLGAHEALLEGDFGQGGEHVQAGDGLGEFQDRGGVGIGDLVTDAAEELELQIDDLLLRAQDLGFVFFQGRRDVALGVGRGLLAVVLGRHGDVAAGFGDLNVVAEDIVVADLEVLDPGAFALGLFQLGDKAFAAGTQVAQAVQFVVIAVFDEAPITHQQRRFIYNGGFQQFGEFRGGGSHDDTERAQSAAFRGPDQCGDDFGHGEQGLLQGHEVSGVGLAAADAGGQTFQVGDTAQGVAQVAAQEGVPSGLGDSGLAVVDLVQTEQGLVEPFAQQASAHGRDGLVQNGNQALAAHAVGQGLGQL
jgi:hypothetical protein